MSWTTTTRTAAEELGPPGKKNSSKGCEPHDHYITEAYFEFTQEVRTLLNACRRRADHSEGEGPVVLSVVVNERTEKPLCLP